MLTRTLRSGSINGLPKVANAISTRWQLGMITMTRNDVSGISKRLKSQSNFSGETENITTHKTNNKEKNKMTKTTKTT